jgi:protein phosphatase
MRESEPLEIRILSFGLTDVGRVRPHNEDSLLINDRARLYAVADGMGGHLGGEIASKMAVEILDRATGGERAPLQAAIKLASAAVYARGKEIDLPGMGTTVTAVIFDGAIAAIGHVGDSRAYLIREGAIEQLSVDHSLVAEQMRAGLITPEQARSSRFKNIITRSVGFEQDVAVDQIIVPVREGDVFVLCSDGLAGLVEAEEIRDVVHQSFLSQAPRALVDLANARGGADNITVIVLAVSAAGE